jgi:hypothetical protein
MTRERAPDGAHAAGSAPSIAHQRDRLLLEELAIEADRVFYRALVEGLGVR